MATEQSRTDRLAYFMLKKVNRAIRDYEMIQDGDRIAVALSGGKDSFTLLELLRYRQRFVAEKYTVAAIHVIGDARGIDLPPHPELPKWLDASGIEYLIRPTHLADAEAIPQSCHRCSWNRRRTLFEMAKDLGCNKLAFGHHLDDLAQTALLNLMYHGKHETMAPVRGYFDGALTVIRPFAYLPEREIKRYASLMDFPPPPSMCPRGEHTQRKRAKDIIQEMTKDCRDVRWNLASGALRAMAGDGRGMGERERGGKGELANAECGVRNAEWGISRPDTANCPDISPRPSGEG